MVKSVRGRKKLGRAFVKHMGFNLSREWKREIAMDDLIGESKEVIDAEIGKLGIEKLVSEWGWQRDVVT